MKKSVAKNYIYNLIYQMLTILLPLVTTPYLSRVLGAENIGIYGYTISIVTYFILFGTLGVSMYGQREIAYNQNDTQKRSKIFWEIVLIRTVTLGLSILIFFLVYGRSGDYAIYYNILIVQLVANLFDISWFFQGIEEFDKTVIRNLIVKLLSLILIFVVIKNSNDLWKYFVIFVGAELLGNVSLWFYLPKYIQKINIKTIELKKHVKPVFSLFIPQIAIQIYTVLDKTMIGKITGDMVEVGYYEQAQKIVKTALVLLSALQIVMNSRIANAFSNKNELEVKDYLKNSFNFVWFLVTPIVFGIIAVASKFVPWYYGEGFEGVTLILIATVPILFSTGLNGITGIQYLVQVGKQNIFTMSVAIGAAVNVIFNFIFIRLWGGVGAAIASIVAETVILAVQLIYFKKQFTVLEILKLSVKCIISGIVMFIVVKLLTNYLNVSIVNTIIEVIAGAIVYILMLTILRYQFLKDLFNQLFIGIKSKLRGEN